MSICFRHMSPSSFSYYGSILFMSHVVVLLVLIDLMPSIFRQYHRIQILAYNMSLDPLSFTRLAGLIYS